MIIVIEKKVTFLSFRPNTIYTKSFNKYFRLIKKNYLKIIKINESIENESIE